MAIETAAIKPAAVKTSREEAQELYFALQKFPWLYPLAMVLISLADLSLLYFYYRIQYLQERTIIVQLLAIHIVLFILVYILRVTSSPQTKEMSPLIFLLLPGIGSLLFSLTYLVLFVLGSRIKKDNFHHAYTDTDVEYQRSLSVDLGEVRRLMDLAGIFGYGDSSDKKGVIVDLLSGDLSANARLLKQGLADNDPEVVHYTASTLNYLEERYERAIQKARSKCVETLSRECLFHVATLYNNYMDSGLLDDDILPVYRASFIQVLELLTREFGDEDEEVLCMLAVACYENGMEERAREVLQRALDLFPSSVIVRFTEMKLAFEANQLEQVGNIARLIDGLGAPLTREQQGLVDFWMERHELQGGIYEQR